jgi:hypothetical protein
VKWLCAVVKVARSSFYAWLAAADTRAGKTAADEVLTARIRAVHDGDSTYGAPRITAELNDGAAKAGGVTPMSCAPTATVATPTMAAAAVPSAACARRRLGVERPGLTVVIAFLHMLIGLGMCLKTARCGRGCHRC